MTLPPLTLVLGGAASGKSAFAESLLLRAPVTPVYIATAQAFDAEMTAKIAAHRAMRGDGWTTVEAPLDPAGSLPKLPKGSAVLIDCATLWLSNLMHAGADPDAEVARLLAAIAAHAAPVVVVSNEVGQGIVPENRLARAFRNAQGRLNQQIAAEAACVVMVIAGLPMVLKGTL